jgi:tetratricopeptide (TPR) repeat protein
MRILTSLLCALALAACAAQRPAPTPPAAAAAAADAADAGEARRLLAQALQQARAHDYVQADTTVTHLLADPGFAALAAPERHQGLSLGAMLAMESHDPRRAQTLAVQACQMHEAQSYDWLLRVESGIAAGDGADVVLASEVVAERWPELLPQSLQGLDGAGEALRYQVLSALLAFSMAHEPLAASGWWRDLALLQLARGERSAAVATLGRIQNAYVAVSVAADRRFDPVWPQVQERLNVENTAQRAIDAAAKRAQANPDRLQPLNELAVLLGDSLLLEQVLQVADSAIEQVSKWGASAYADYDPEYSQLLDQRAQVLAATGRWDAALIQLQAASQLPENGADNVSQVIDLAALYNDLGRSAEARATLARLKPDNTSAVGIMQSQKEALRAALATGDAAAAEAALQFLGTHRAEALDVYQEALLVAGHEEAGAKLMIERLGNPRTRSSALLAVQSYEEVALTPVQQSERQRWQALLSRADVREAVGRVGRVASYRLAGDNYY